MSRISALDPATVQGKAKSLLDAVHAAFGMTPNLFRVVAHSPAALEGLLGLHGALSGGALDAKTREAVALAVAEANQCDYCLSAHTALAASAGLSEVDIARARDGRGGDTKTEGIVRTARALVRTRGRIAESELAQLRQTGVTDREIIELVSVVALNILTNYLNHVAGTDIDFPVVKARPQQAA